MTTRAPRPSLRLRRLLAVGLALPLLAGAGVCGDVLYDISQRALILDPVERVRFTSDSGAVEVFAFDRTAINLLYYLRGSEHDIGAVGYEVAAPELRAFIRCDDPDGFCAADFNVEVPLGTEIVAETMNGGVKLTGVDADVDAVVAGGDFVGVGLRCPTLAVEVEEGDVVVDMRAPPDSARVSVGAGAVDLTLPAGSYRCELRASDGAVTITDIVCDPAAARLVAIDVTTGDIRLRAAP